MYNLGVCNYSRPIKTGKRINVYHSFSLCSDYSLHGVAIDEGLVVLLKEDVLKAAVSQVKGKEEEDGALVSLISPSLHCLELLVRSSSAVRETLFNDGQFLLDTLKGTVGVPLVPNRKG